jgi:hypothetical protein
MSVRAWAISGIALLAAACSSPGRQAAWETERENRRAHAETSTSAKMKRRATKMLAQIDEKF